MKTLIAGALLLAFVAGACGSDDSGGTAPLAGRDGGGQAGAVSGGSGGTAGGSGGGGGVSPGDARRDADAPAPSPDLPPFAPAPSNLPVLLFDFPGVPFETLGGVKAPGTVKIIESQGMEPGAPSRVGLALIGTVASRGSFTFELRDATDQPRRDGLIGLPHQGDWIVQSCDFADKPCVRNLLAFDIAAKLSPGAPKARMIEVYYNEEYRGLFQFIAPAAKFQGRVADLPDPTDGVGRSGERRLRHPSQRRGRLRADPHAPGRVSLDDRSARQLPAQAGLHLPLSSARRHDRGTESLHRGPHRGVRDGDEGAELRQPQHRVPQLDRRTPASATSSSWPR